MKISGIPGALEEITEDRHPVAPFQASRLQKCSGALDAPVELAPRYLVTAVQNRRAVSELIALGAADTAGSLVAPHCGGHHGTARLARARIFR